MYFSSDQKPTWLVARLDRLDPRIYRVTPRRALVSGGTEDRGSAPTPERSGAGPPPRAAVGAASAPPSPPRPRPQSLVRRPPPLAPRAGLESSTHNGGPWGTLWDRARRRVRVARDVGAADASRFRAALRSLPLVPQPRCATRGAEGGGSPLTPRRPLLPLARGLGGRGPDLGSHVPPPLLRSGEGFKKIRFGSRPKTPTFLPPRRGEGRTLGPATDSTPGGRLREKGRGRTSGGPWLCSLGKGKGGDTWG